MNPDDPMAYNNLAVAYEGIGEFEKAREAYLRALQIDRSNQYVQRNYSRFVEFYSKKESRSSEIAESEKKSATVSPGDETATEEQPEADPAAPVEEGEDDSQGQKPVEPEGDREEMSR